jgi:hypothetical protein
VIKLLDSRTNNEDFEAQLIKLMQDVILETRKKGAITPFEKTISARTNLLYLNALLKAKLFDDYIGTACQIAIDYSPNPFAKNIMAQASLEASTTLKDYLQDKLYSTSTLLQKLDTMKLNQALKSLKDTCVLLIKITAYLMEGIGNLQKTDTEIVSSMQSIITIISPFVRLFFYNLAVF